MEEHIKLTVGSAPVPLNGYVHKVFLSVIRSLVGTLHGVNEEDEITIEITKKPEETQRP